MVLWPTIGDPPLLLSYNQALVAGVEQVGAKAYSLALLSAAGLPIPDGVVLPMDHWLLCGGTEGEERLRTAVEARVVGPRYIIRSSAVGEDPRKHSWAGCFDSVAGVEGPGLAAAASACIESLHGPRALAYSRLHAGMDPLTKMALVIQHYLLADISGVAFSVNAVSGDSSQMVVEFQRGKTGGVVGGEGVVESVYPCAEVANTGSSELPWLSSLQETVRTIEAIFDGPVDVEWLLMNGALYVTQARPLTGI